MNKKKILWTLAAVLLAVLSITAVLSQAGSLSFADIKASLLAADPLWLGLAVLAMLGFIICEGEAVLSLLKSTGYPRKHRQGFLFSAGDVYFSAITPSASGGQPVSAILMHKSGIPLSISTAVLIMNLVMYTLAILTLGAFCLIAVPDVYFQFGLIARILIVAGYITMGLLGLGFVMMLKERKIIVILASWGFRILHRLHLLKDPRERILKLEHKMDDYQLCVLQMRGHWGALIRAYLWNLGQRVSQISVTMFVYLATGESHGQAFRVWSTQCFVAIGSCTVPIPGGMGVADYLMLDGFRAMMDNLSAVQLEILSRSLAFYVCILVSGIATAIGFGFYFVKNKHENRKSNR